MFSTVGPTSPWPGASVVSPQSPRAAGTVPDPAAVSPGETGASAVRAETSLRIDPVAQATTAPRLPDGDRSGPRFRLVPQPSRPEEDAADAPAGPPPAFRRNLLEARRDEVASSAATAPELATEGSDADPLLDVIRRIMAEAGPIAVPPSAEDRAEAEFTALRRMEEPLDRGSLDVSR
jgi:hypothetical protein